MEIKRNVQMLKMKVVEGRVRGRNGDKLGKAAPEPNPTHTKVNRKENQKKTKRNLKFFWRKEQKNAKLVNPKGAAVAKEQ